MKRWMFLAVFAVALGLGSAQLSAEQLHVQWCATGPSHSEPPAWSGYSIVIGECGNVSYGQYGDGGWDSDGGGHGPIIGSGTLSDPYVYYVEGFAHCVVSFCDSPGENFSVYGFVDAVWDPQTQCAALSGGQLAVTLSGAAVALLHAPSAFGFGHADSGYLCIAPNELGTPSPLMFELGAQATFDFVGQPPPINGPVPEPTGMVTAGVVLLAVGRHFRRLLV